MSRPTPHVVVFACNWCAYTAADLAGTTRLDIPSGFTVIRVMCTGRVDPVHVMRALVLGADAVVVAGCHRGDCHYTTGNLHAEKRVDFLAEVLAALGLAGRLEMHHISAAEGQRFQSVMTAVQERVAGLGPSPLGAAATLLPGGKRETFRQLLATIVTELDIDLSGIAAIEDLPGLGFGEPVFSSQRCTGCQACYQSCPAGNIATSSDAATMTISHYHSRCVACSTCAEVCPEHAIEVMERFDLPSFLADQPSVAVELELVLCPSCGGPNGAKRQAEALASPRSPAPTCPSCRRSAHARTMHRYLHPSPNRTRGEMT
jgi:F420-non-reducing hydrogenase iron-sulfur subunit